MIYKEEDKAEIVMRLIIEDDRIEGDLLDRLIDCGITKHWTKGQEKFPSKPKCKLAYKINGCEFESKTYDFEVPFNQFWRSLKSSGKLLYLIDQNQLSPRLSIAIYSYEFMPAIYLEAPLIAELASHNIEMDLDIYCLGEE